MRRLRVHSDARLLLTRLFRIIAGVAILTKLSWGYDLAEKVMHQT
jgi:hypothetical protein